MNERHVTDRRRRKPRRTGTAGGPPVSRELIATVASRLFRQHGYDGTSIAAIAEAVGVTPPALYWYFDSKADILFEFLRDTLDAFTATVDGRLDGAVGPVERLRAFAVAHTEAQLERVELASTFGELIFSTPQLARSLDQAQIDALGALQQRHYRLCRSIIDEGVRSGAFRVPNTAAAAFAVINFCEYVNTWFDPSGPLSVAEVAQLNGTFAVRLVGGEASS